MLWGFDVKIIFSYELRETLKFKPVFLRLKKLFTSKPHNTYVNDNLNAEKTVFNVILNIIIMKN